MVLKKKRDPLGFLTGPSVCANCSEKADQLLFAICVFSSLEWGEQEQALV
jgi:hypothetical protein